VSKLLEQFVALQFRQYLQLWNILPVLQSGFCLDNSILHVLSDLLGAVDSGDVAALVLLYLFCSDMVNKLYADDANIWLMPTTGHT